MSESIQFFIMSCFLMVLLSILFLMINKIIK